MGYFEDVADAVIRGDRVRVKELTEQGLAQGRAPEDVVNDGLVPAMGLVGERFGRGEIFVPEMLVSARAMYAGLDILRPLLVAGKVKERGTVVIGTVKGDLHDIGKNLVAMMTEGAGFKIVNLGVDVPAQKFVEAVKENKADVMAMSALLTTTMGQMRTSIETLKEAGLRDKVKVVIGGAPITQRFANEIGADGYGADANAAVVLVKGLLGIAEPAHA